ncbi:hypothetical protein M413DRAFT_22437 [Hebeloma cylindrosporum]|uniref:Protein YOP1 n=1 Tax=Hebeloma cylindrosporum TaxID=76867 RepID=A0A0C3CUP4_HEBCY|nr:hypothetical protein M413DRAFT_22437 [Hebeloma cylindrosporum h7]
MFMSTISRVLCAWFAFLLPCYATFKALSHRPISEPDLHKWAMYWAVIGAFVAFEYLAEWLISWLPFYWEIKTIFLLFLSLPQTQGSTYVYNTYLQPFLLRNETDLDAGIVTIQRNILTFIQGKLSAAWDLVVSNRNAQTQSANPGMGAPSQLSWFLSTDVWRSAMNLVQASSSRADAYESTLATPLQNKNAAPSDIPSNPPFPTPQHYQ